MWGSMENTNVRAAPKIFKLVGVPAESVAALSSEVSQQITGAEERVALVLHWLNLALCSLFLVLQ